MRKIIAAMLALMPLAASADTYQVTFGWTDPTVYLPSEYPTYEAKYRVNVGTEIVLPTTATPGGSTTVTATPGQPIDIAVRNCNQSLCSNWSSWVTATAPHPPTQPGAPVGLTITVVRQ